MGAEFLESSLDREQNRLLLHIAPFKLFLFWTLQLLLPAGVISGDNNQASARKRQTAPNSLESRLQFCRVFVFARWINEVILSASLWSTPRLSLTSGFGFRFSLLKGCYR